MSTNDSQSHEFQTPDHAAQSLRARPESATPRAASTTYSVCLGPSNNGWFTLSWSAAAIGNHDWVGLYANASDDDSKYVGGNNWQWATKGTSYVTSTAVQPGYQARYLIWDSFTGKYVSVARTPAYPAAVCSS